MTTTVKPEPGMDVEKGGTQTSAQAERTLAEANKIGDEPTEVDIAPDRTRESRTPSFSRMSTEWGTANYEVVNQVRNVVDGLLLQDFSEAYVIMSRVFDLVREPERTLEGFPVKDHLGFTVWKRDEDGAYIEDWTLLTRRDKENLILSITSRMMEWEQAAGNAWGEAMLSKGMWEERYAMCFDEPTGKLTVEDRTQRGRLGSRDERYFAIFKSLYSRRADAITKSMERLSQRLKDILEA